MIKREANLVQHFLSQAKYDNCFDDINFKRWYKLVVYLSDRKLLPPSPQIKGKFVENAMKIDDVGTMPYIVQN